MKVLKHTKDKQMETDITSFDATELAHLIATKQLSPVEIMKSHIEVIEKINPKINALVTLADDSLEKAKAFLGEETNIVIEEHKHPTNLLEHYKIDVTIYNSLKPRVDLPSGGYIIIEPTGMCFCNDQDVHSVLRF